jgi:hypothetical protein|tara:strand:+ start:205 stop:447 length:243 start_codon:yes stop_codon:yes gene_type:complete
MTKKKKSEIKKIYVKKPKIGESYWFWFAGGITHGVLMEKDEKLTDHYNEPWYILQSKSGMRYPIGIFKLRHDRPIIKHDV